jgi:hypothetical protein
MKRPVRHIFDHTEPLLCHRGGVDLVRRVDLHATLANLRLSAIFAEDALHESNDEHDRPLAPGRGRGSASQPERIGVWQALDFSSLQRRHGAGFVEPDVLIELLRQVSLKVMARELSFGPVDDADRPL